MSQVVLPMRARKALLSLTQMLGVMAFGAFATVSYLSWSRPALKESLRDLNDGFRFTMMALLLVSSLLERGITPERPMRHPPPAGSGTSVVLVTGVMAAIMFYQASAVAAGIIMTGTFCGAVFVWRFAKRHEHEIGEARFNTSGRE